MITTERLGVRADGNPVTETSSYISAAPDHPLAVTLVGHEGHWVRIAVGNHLESIGAKPVTQVEYNAAQSKLQEKVSQIAVEFRERQDVILREIEAKKGAIRAELSALGLSSDAVAAILAQVR